MAIDRMKYVTVLAPRRQTDSLLDWLQEREVMHVEEPDEESAEGLKRPARSTEDVDTRIHELRHILHVFENFGVAESSLADMVVELPRRVTRRERDRVLREFDYRPVYEVCSEADDDYHHHENQIEQAEEEIENLEFFQALPFTPDDVRSLDRARAWMGTLPADQYDSLQENPEEWKIVAVQDLRRRNREVDVVAVALTEEAEEAGRILRRHKFSERTLPTTEGTISERLNDLRAQIEKHRRATEKCRRRIEDMAPHQDEVEVVLGYWEGERQKIEARNSSLNSRRISLLRGYVREKDRSDFEDDLQEDFPQVSTVYRDPTPEDDVPVSLSHGPLVAPVRFLVDMFGLPDYFSFDPTPYLSLSFIVFFGLCFGDVVYGVLLCLVALFLARKSRGYEGLQNMCMTFFYCGVSTFVIGLLTGAWAADLPERLAQQPPPQQEIQQEQGSAETSALGPATAGGAAAPGPAESTPQTQPAQTQVSGFLWFRNAVSLVHKEGWDILSPEEEAKNKSGVLTKAVMLLLVVLGIGIINQIYGVILNGYGLLRRGKTFEAFCDAGLWLVALPGFLILASAMFFDVPKWFVYTGAVMLSVSGVGLILTQGRHEESFIGKAITGVVSLYGIMGSYGCMQFLADMLSYSRLLALGLTTGIVGMSFNIVAGLASDIPYAGYFLFVLIIVGGHLFNFCVSMIAAFVHPARLIFLEFFNRFYESGGRQFQPLSMNTESVLVE